MINREIRTTATDLRAPRFQDQEVWLPALMMAALQAGERAITGRSFTNCLLHGPAVFLAAGGNAMNACNMGFTGGDTRNLLLRPVSPTGVIGAIPFADCRFEWCDFDAVGFTGNEAFIASILGVPEGEVG
ncbi:MAG: hypothetical protein KY449_09270 [Proteobacteria bacterium]|nr:hypothetical protein [Pseudomonadota bacterium]